SPSAIQRSDCCVGMATPTVKSDAGASPEASASEPPRVPLQPARTSAVVAAMPTSARDLFIFTVYSFWWGDYRVFPSGAGRGLPEPGWGPAAGDDASPTRSRSEERRVGAECRARVSGCQ